ncbi:CapA family protein, partial [Acinetobacter baumannii]
RLDFYGVQVEPAEAPGERRRLDQGDLAVHVAAIAAAAAAGDFVLAYAHHHLWEAEWAATPAWFRELARCWLDAGAGLVASHGVPMLQAIEV